MEKWLIARGYDERSIRAKVLDARSQKRVDLLSREKSEKPFKLTLNITYHPAFQNLNKTLRKNHAILAYDKKHQEVFKEIPIIGFRKGKCLKDFLVRAKVQPLERESGSCAKCLKCDKRCQMSLRSGTIFTDKKGNTHSIRVPNLHCNSTNVVYLITCKSCGLQYVGSTIRKFRLRHNVYRSSQNLHTTKKVKQQQFHEHFSQPGHLRWADFDIMLIDQGNSTADTRKREMFWQYKLNTFIPEGLNDRDVDVHDSDEEDN